MRIEKIGEELKKESRNKIFLFFLFLIFFTGFSYAQNYYHFTQEKEYEMFFPSIQSGSICNKTQNFLVYVDPIEGCKPSPIRSDLIEDQPVVVFCKLKAINLNPLLQNIYIKNIYIKVENKSDLVRGVAFHMPYIGEKFLSHQIYGYKGTATFDNIGYATVFLSQQPDERKIPKEVFVNATARIEYNAGYLFGIDRNTFLIPEMSKEEWKDRASEFSFFNGKGFVRVKKIYGDMAEIEVYKEINDPLPYILTLKKGQSAKLILWGFFCENQNFEILLDSLEIPKTAARLIINGNEYLLYEGEDAEDCRVISIEPHSIKGSGSVIISCEGKTTKLSLEPISVILKIKKNGNGKKEETIEVAIGEEIRLDNKKAYLVCVDEKSAYIFYKDKEEIKRKEVNDILKKIKYENGKISCEEIGDKKGVIKISKGETKEINNVNIEVGEIKIFYDKTLNDEVEKSFDETKSKYYQLFYNYKNEKDKDNEYIGAKALLEFAELAEEIGKRSEAINALSLIEQEYGDSIMALKARERKLKLINLDYKKASQTIEKGGRIWNIKLVSLESPYSFDIKARISIDGEERDVYVLSSLGGGWVVKEISDDYVVFENRKEEKTIKIWRGREDILPIGEDGLRVKVINTQIKKVAKIVVKPPEQTFFAESNFTLRIGIEKRAIKVSPEKALEISKKINETIKKLEEVNRKLEKVVSNWQKACWIGGTSLFLKNFVAGISGEALARKIVMRGVDGKGGWTKICEEKIKEERDIKTLTECYRKYEDKINKDVEKIKGFIDDVNNIIGGRKKECERETNRDKYIDCLFSDGKIASELNELKIDTEKDTENYTETLKNLTKQGYFFEDKIKEILLSKKIANCKEECSEEMKKLEEERLKSLLGYYKELNEVLRKGQEDTVDLSPSPYTIKVRLKEINGLNDKIKECLNQNIENKSTHYFVGRKDGKIYYVGVKKIDRIVEVVKICDNEGSEVIVSGIKIEEAECGSIDNRYLYVSFFNVPPNLDRVGYIPIDIEKGYYAFVENKPDSYYESGAVAEFWICNVGNDGIPNLLNREPMGDYCMFISDKTGHNPYIKVCEDHPPISFFVEKAKRCIAEANQRKRMGQSIETSCGRFKAQTQIPIETMQCEDFMSPTDCRLLFNLCDPVLCPPSRCNLGGRYYVDNVVRTGIIGSLVLCLPNFENGQGVLMPICLTGIKAGLDNLIHILKETSKCFEVSAKRGENIGFCDQLKSFYLCDLMWRELTPFIKAGIPSILQKIERRGGGEYAKFSETWKNTFDGLSYFVQVYGVTATEAFKLRNTGELGKMVCGRFFGIKYPKATSLLEELGKPPSPYQFFVKADEIPYTEVTYPPQSHYKVFYYIYAGTDQDVWYSIYLKNPPSYSGVNVPSIYVVATGFLPRGQSSAESPDFIAVSGYKEICININGKEECGFEVVSSSYVVNWLQDKYVENQIKQNIKSREECISGKPSLIPTASLLNLQAGIEKIMSPAIYREGIVRICSTFNPGKGVEEENWKAIGECDSQTKCWVYLPSIKRALKDLGIENQTIEWAEKKHKEIFKILEATLSEEEINKLVNEINSAVEGAEKEVNQTKENIEKGKDIDIDKTIKEINKNITKYEKERTKILNPDALKQYDQNLARLYKYRTLLIFYKHYAEEIGKEKKEEGEKEEEIINAILVAGEEKEFSTQSRTIEYNDNDTKVCVLLHSKEGNYYNEVIWGKTYISNEEKIEKFSNSFKNVNIKITWQIIQPKFTHEKKDNCNTTYKSEVKIKGEHNCSKKVYWIELGERDYEIIEYEAKDIDKPLCVDSKCWCIKPKKENGTYWYRAIVEIGGKKYYAGPRFLNETNKEEYKEAIKSKNYSEGNILADYLAFYSSFDKWNEDTSNWYYAGLITLNPEKALRISRKSNFGIGDNHREWCNQEENKQRCEFIRLLESYYNVPYVEWHPRIDLISDEYLAMECASVVNTTLAHILEKTPKLKWKGKGKMKNLLSNVQIKTGDIIDDSSGYYVIVDENDDRRLDNNDALIYASFNSGQLVRKKINELMKFLGDREITIYSPFNENGDGKVV
jgi:hypothetical protein